MYENAGRSIKSVVKVCVIISMVFSVIAGLAVMGTAGSFGSFIVGLLIMGIGCFFSWLSGLTLYAYGEMADRLVSIDEKLDAMAYRNASAVNQNAYPSGAHKVNSYGTSAGYRPTSVPMNAGNNSYDNIPTWKRVQMEQEAKEKAAANAAVTCASCGTKNASGCKFCVMCGHSLNP